MPGNDTILVSFKGFTVGGPAESYDLNDGETATLGVRDPNSAMMPFVTFPDWAVRPTVFGGAALPPTGARPNTDRALMAYPVFLGP